MAKVIQICKFRSRILKLAPIILFVYNRPSHTRQTIEALLNNSLAKESELFIYSDAPRDQKTQEKVKEVREYIHTITGFKNITVIERDKNFGLADNIVDGVTSVINQYGEIIVLEDDIVVSPMFLEYINKGLKYYKNQRQICSITGSCFLKPYQYKNTGIHALSITSSWGWATWKDRWDGFSRQDEVLKSIIDNTSIHHSFDFDESYPYIKMAKLQLKRKINSWAIYWYAYNFLQSKLTIYPNAPLIINNGFDGSGYHCKKTDSPQSQFAKRYSIDFAIIAQECHETRKIIKKNFKQYNKIKNILFQFPKLYIGIFRTLNFLKMLKFKKKIGKNTIIAKTSRITGWGCISIGCNTIIGEHSWINVNQRNQNAIIIGNYCYLGFNTFLSSGHQIVIKDYAMLTIGSKILGANHNTHNPLEPYISTGVSNHQRTIIGYNVWIGADALIVGGVEIGYGSIIGAGSIVTQNIPPFSIAVGSPAKVIKRYDFSQHCWKKIDEYDEEKNGKLMPTDEEYLHTLQSKDITMPYMALGKEMGDLF